MLAAAEQQRVFALDLPGFGGSISLDADYSIAGYVHTLRQFAAAVGVTRFRFICHSLGGQVCLGLALDAPSLVESLVLIDAAGSYDRKEYLERLSRGTAGRVRPDRDPGISALLHGDVEILRRLLDNEPVILAALGSFRENYHNRLRDLHAPALIIWGADDPIFPVAYAFFLKENIEGSVLRVVANAGHSPQLSEPGLVLDWIREFNAGPTNGREPMP